MKVKKELLIIGGGFAGFWSAISAIRQSKELKRSDELSITILNLDEFITIRPRLYETSLDGLRLKLDDYLSSFEIKLLIGKAEMISVETKQVTVSTESGFQTLHYDYLILASGSTLKNISLPGIEIAHNIDSYTGAKELETHILEIIRRQFLQKGDECFVIAGGGFTGIEIAAMLNDTVQHHLKKYFNVNKTIKVILIEKENEIAQGYTGEAKQYIYDILKQKNIEIITGVYITAIYNDHITLSNGQSIVTKTVVWTIGMIASPLTSFFNTKKDNLGRVCVNAHLKCPEYKNIIFAGDVANVVVDKVGNAALMACQFSMDLGKLAGHNAVNDLFGIELIPYQYPNYVTCLDLGSSDSLLTTGWERTLKLTGEKAKEKKKFINEIFIYPSLSPLENLKNSIPKFMVEINP